MLVKMEGSSAGSEVENLTYAMIPYQVYTAGQGITVTGLSIRPKIINIAFNTAGSTPELTLITNFDENGKYSDTSIYHYSGSNVTEHPLTITDDGFVAANSFSGVNRKYMGIVYG